METQQNEGFLEGLFKSTLGSRGIGGLVSSIPRSIANYSRAQGTLGSAENGLALSQSTSQLAQELMRTTDPAKKARLSNQIRIALGQSDQMRQSNLSNISKVESKQQSVRDVVGMTVNSLVTLAPFAKVGTAFNLARGTLASANTLRSPVLFHQGSKAFFQSASLRAIQTGTLTGGYSLGEGLQKEGNLPDVLKETAEGFVWGSAFSFAASGVSLGVRSLASANNNQAAKNLMDSAFRQTTAQERKEIQSRAPELSEQLLKLGVKGTSKQAYATATTGLNETEKLINQELVRLSQSGANATIDMNKLATNALDPVIERVTKVRGADAARELINIKNLWKSKGVIPAQEALDLKRILYSELGSRAFKVDASLAPAKEALQGLASNLRTAIGDVSPEVARLTRQQQTWIRLMEVAEGNLARAKGNSLIGLRDVVLASGGGADVGSLMLTVGARVVETTKFKTGLAQLLYRLGNETSDDVAVNTIMNGASGPLKNVYQRILDKIKPRNGKVSRLMFANYLSGVIEIYNQD